LNASSSARGVQLTWKGHDGHPEFISIERRAGGQAQWQAVSKLPANTSSFSDNQNFKNGESISYRVRAGNASGSSAYSNVATLRQ
jgi:hypothetical protein